MHPGQEKFSPEELEAITSQDYHRRKVLSGIDVLTITDLYSLGEYNYALCNV